MRLIDPRDFNNRKSVTKRPRIKLITTFVIFLFVSFLTVLLIYRSQQTIEKTSVLVDAVSVSSPVVEPNTEVPIDVVLDTIRVFTDDEFKVFFNNVLLPDLKRVENPPTITGNDEADVRIRKIAEDRGYQLQNLPSAELQMIDGFTMQTLAVLDWNSLKKSATAAGYKLELTSAYRSVDDQRVLFLQSLRSAGISVASVAAGNADEAVYTLLKRAAPPGYSKHHTGYTIDIACNGVGSYNLKETACYSWFTAENFLQLKEFGWIPSYPETAQFLGPDPEPWELVWVGRDRLLE